MIHRLGLVFAAFSVFVNGQFIDCSAPTCTLTTTTTTDIVTIASVVNITSTIIVSQNVHLQCVNSTTTSLLLTSTCSSCLPSKRVETCGFSNGGFVVVFSPRPFVSQLETCRYLGMDLAELSFENFPVAADVTRKCLGQQRKAFIKSYEGDAQPCLVLNTGEKMKHDPVFGANIEVSCCDSHYPALCQEFHNPNPCHYCGKPNCHTCHAF